MTRRGCCLPTTFLVALVAAVLLLSVGGLALPAAMAAAAPGHVPATDEHQPPLRLTVNSLSPVVLRSASGTALAGTVTNTTTGTMSDLNLRVALSFSRYFSINALDTALTVTQQLSTHRLSTTRLRIPASLPPGASAAWKAILPAHAFDSVGNGVYVLQVSVLSSSVAEFAGVARVALPWFDNPNDSGVTKPMRLTMLLPVTSLPDRTVAGPLLYDTLGRDLAGDGRLSRLVDGAAANPDKITWVVDPALLQTVQQMSDGYSVVTSDGAAGPPQPGGAAAAWLAKIRAATSVPGTNVLALTYADADVTSLAVRGMTSDITLANTTAPELIRDLLGKPDVRSFAWPAGSATTADTLAALYVAGVRMLKLDREALTDLGPEAPGAAVETKSGPLSAVVGDEALATTLAGSSTEHLVAGVAQRQLFLAQTAIYSQVEHRATAVVAPPLTWSVDPTSLGGILSALGSAPWLQPASIGDALAEKQVVPVRTLTPLTTAARRQLLSAAYLRSVRAQQAEVSLLAAVTAPAGIAADFTAGLLRSESAAWRADRSGANRLLQLNDQQLLGTVAKIRPVASNSVTFSEGSGNVPVTVANELKVPVRVGIKLVADPAVRLVQSPPVVIEVPAATKASAEIPTQVLGAGALPVEIQLTTPDGQNFGKPARTTLRTTAYAKAASYVVVAAFVALTATVVISSLRRRRRLAVQARDTQASDDD